MGISDLGITDGDRSLDLTKQFHFFGASNINTYTFGRSPQFDFCN
ncbi:MAG: hypothetical protein WBA89_06490 [Microcoleus sp.]